MGITFLDFIAESGIHGSYAKILFDKFSKERVEAELEKFLEFDFFPRVGGGIGMTRMIAALDKK